MNCEKVANTIQTELKNFIGDKNAVIGISGGLDSAVVATLCVNAVGKDKVIGVEMPYGKQSIQDGCTLVKHLDIVKRDYVINIKSTVDGFKSTLWMLPDDKIASGNIRARVRMIILYDFANSMNGLVIGTGNKTELMLGYETKFGDGGCDIEPIGDLYKTEVFELAKYLGVPDCIINKAPSAELWEGQTDEGEIGMSYAEMDGILKEIKNIGVSELVTKDIFSKYGEKNINNILNRIKNAEHKRNIPKTILVDKGE